MTTALLRNAALAFVATAGLALAPAAAHAEPKGGPGPAAKGCTTETGDTMSSGTTTTWSDYGSKGSISCNNGTVCKRWKTLQGDGTWASFSECKYSPARSAPRANAGPRPTTVKG